MVHKYATDYPEKYSPCFILPLSLKNYKEDVYIRYTFVFVNGDACVEQESDLLEILCTRRSRQKSELPAGTDFSKNSLLYIVLKLPCDPHAMPFFFSSVTAHTYTMLVYNHVMLSYPSIRLTSMQCVFFIAYGLHSRDAFSPLVTA